MNFVKSMIQTFAGKDAKTAMGQSQSQSKEDAYYYTYYRRLEKKPEAEMRRVMGLATTQAVGANVFHLEKFEVTGEISDSSSSTVFHQFYKNESKQPVEAIYQLPLAPYASVCAFEVRYDDKVYVGKVKEKTRAAEKYSDQIASGGQAMMGEKSGDFFKISIGNLPAGKAVSVKLTMVSEIGMHLDSLHYCLHRYMFPAYPFKFKCELSVKFLSSSIKKLVLDHYDTKIKTAEDKKSATVKFEADGVKHNIILVVQPDDSDKPSYFIEKSEDSYAVALNFYPNFKVSKEEIDQKAEFIFLLDCSGSMAGGPINSAKRALDIIMRSLNENCKFNIYIFGSHFKKLFTQSRVYDDESLAEANQYIEQISANLGGTNLSNPVQDILRSRHDPEYPRQLFILTDGEITDREKLLEFVGTESDSTRIFTLGIGLAVDQELVVGLSKACKGYFEFIKKDDEMETQVFSLLSIAMEPTLSNVKVDWNSSELEVSQAPKLVRPVYNKERMMIYALVDKKLTDANLVKIELTGNGPSGSLLTYPIELDFSKASTASKHLHTIAAFNLVNDLEKEDSKSSNPSNKSKIIEIAKKYTLVSKHTSFLVTIDSDTVTEDSMRTVDIKSQKDNGRFDSATPFSSSRSSQIHVDQDFSMLSMAGSTALPPPPGGGGAPRGMPKPQSRSKNSTVPPSPPPSMIPSRPLAPSAVSSNCLLPVDQMIPNFQSQTSKMISEGNINSPSVSSKCLLPEDELILKSKSQTPVKEEKKIVITKTGDTALDLIKSQKANGSWSEDVSALIEIPETPTENGVPLAKEIWITMVVIETIKKLSSNQQSIEMIIQKATKWVKQQLNRANLSNSFDKFFSLAQKSI